MVGCRMGNVNVRKGSQKLYLDFRFRNQRCREQTELNDTPGNRKKLELMMDRVKAEILLGQFDYAKTFPSSKMLTKLNAQDKALNSAAGLPPEFEEFTEIWFFEMQASWRRSYEKTIRMILDHRLIPEFGKKAVDRITKADLLQFRAHLAKVVRKNGKHLSATYINRHMKIMRMILNEAADRYEFTTPYMGIKPLKVPKSDIEPFTPHEIKLILNTVRPDFKDYFTVRFFTGMRTGEIDGLKWRYIDFENRLILIRETIVDGHVEYTKTDGSQRDIQMNQQVFDALQNMQKITFNNEYVFCSKTGTHLRHDLVTKRVWHPLLKHLGLRKRRPYETRHSAATLWLASGENPEWIARQMGHVNTEMLFRIYSRFVPNLTRTDGSAIERMLTNVMAEPNSEEKDNA